jgi:uncharacterized protein YjbI with pentapeptide repeats
MRLRQAQVPEHDENEMISAANEAATYCRTLWIAFITYMGAVFILSAGTTHVDLLLGTPIKMPLFDIGIPLNLFYVIAPLLLVLFHLNLLMKLFDLRQRIYALSASIGNVEQLQRLRHRVIAFDYALLTGNMIINAKERLLLGVITNTTVFVIPLLILLFIQRQFLPAHDPAVTWTHRVLIILDVAQIYLIQNWLSRRLRHPRTEEFARAPHKAARGRAPRIFATSTFGWLGRQWRSSGLIVVVAASLFVLASPDENLDVLWPFAWKYLRPNNVKEMRPNFLAFGYDPSAGIDIAEKFGIKRSLYVTDQVLWSGPIPSDSVLNALDADTIEIKASGIVVGARPALNSGIRGNIGINLRGRNLSFANFENTKLIAADFSPNLTYQQIENLRFGGKELDTFRALYRAEFTDLRGANFSGADMRGASFMFVDAKEATFDSTDLRGARFQNSGLRRASFGQARMEGVKIANSDLRIADLVGANLRGARLLATDLQGAFLAQAQMQGSFLEGMDLRLADMSNANLQASYITSSRFEGTILDDSDISGALLDSMHLQGASLKGTTLRAAYFIASEFRGADFNRAVIDYTRFQESDPDTVGSLEKIHDQDLLESHRARIPEVELKLTCNCEILSVATGSNVWIDGPEKTISEMVGPATAMRAQSLVEYAAGAKAILLDLACGQRDLVASYTDVARHLAAGAQRYVAKGVVEFRAHEPDPWQGLSPGNFKHLDGLASAMLGDSCVKSNLSADLSSELERTQKAEAAIAAGVKSR